MAGRRRVLSATAAMAPLALGTVRILGSREAGLEGGERFQQQVSARQRKDVNI